MTTSQLPPDIKALFSGCRYHLATSLSNQFVQEREGKFASFVARGDFAQAVEVFEELGNRFGGEQFWSRLQEVSARLGLRDHALRYGQRAAATGA
jgi:hypothetical protein